MKNAYVILRSKIVLAVSVYRGTNRTKRATRLDDLVKTIEETRRIIRWKYGLEGSIIKEDIFSKFTKIC